MLHHTYSLAETIVKTCRSRCLNIATAESCTAGLLSACLTSVPGASDVMECGFVTYSESSKSRLLGVPRALIAEHGAVSEPVARAMAEGAQARSGTDLAIAVTGFLGPGGGSPYAPVGTVFLSLAQKYAATSHSRYLYDTMERNEMRLFIVRDAFTFLLDAINARD